MICFSFLKFRILKAYNMPLNFEILTTHDFQLLFMFLNFYQNVTCSIFDIDFKGTKDITCYHCFF